MPCYIETRFGFRFIFIAKVTEAYQTSVKNVNWYTFYFWCLCYVHALTQLLQIVAIQLCCAFHDLPLCLADDPFDFLKDNDAGQAKDGLDGSVAASGAAFLTEAPAPKHLEWAEGAAPLDKLGKGAFERGKGETDERGKENC